jgi:anti-anti-sigma factor
MMDHFELTSDCSLLIIRGDLDGPAVGDQPLPIHEAGRIICDMRRVGAIDVDGLGWLMRLYTRQRKSGGELLLVGPAPRVERMLRQTDLAGLFAWEPSLAAALPRQTRATVDWETCCVA